ncbi:MAG: hypothetical protein Q4P28_02525 [Tissierellia bacterium]|nr:hypothetical protein [Tissierellia bacterium]MDO5755089.1 hypothetical protein [Tissierellia bacterium]
MPLEPNKNGKIEYIGAQYLVFCYSGDFERTKIDDVFIDRSISQPTRNILKDHFVIETYPVILNGTM